MNFSQTLNLGLLIMIWGCAHTPPTPLGDGQVRKVEGWVINNELPGNAAIEVLFEPQIGSCSKVESMPVLILKTDDGKELKSKPECRGSEKVIFHLFEETLQPGQHKVQVDSQGSFQSQLKGQALFYPTEADKKSGPDQAYQGAQAMVEGVNQNTVHSAAADLTDWWTVKYDAYTNVSVFFQHDARKGQITTRLYRLDGANLTLIREIQPNKSLTLGLEGTYYYKVTARPFSPVIQYSISVKKLDEKEQAPGGGGGGVKTADFRILEIWPIDGVKSAILIQAQPSSPVKEGDTLKIFSGSNFLDVCKVVGVSAAEFECHINKTLQSSSKLTARRSL